MRKPGSVPILEPVGNAHSEYLGPLAEAGVFGLLSLLLVIGTTIYTGIRVHYTAKRRSIRIILTGCSDGTGLLLFAWIAE